MYRLVHGTVYSVQIGAWYSVPSSGKGRSQPPPPPPLQAINNFFCWPLICLSLSSFPIYFYQYVWHKITGIVSNETYTYGDIFHVYRVLQFGYTQERESEQMNRTLPR